MQSKSKFYQVILWIATISEVYTEAKDPQYPTLIINLQYSRQCGTGKRRDKQTNGIGQKPHENIVNYSLTKDQRHYNAEKIILTNNAGPTQHIYVKKKKISTDTDLKHITKINTNWIRGLHVTSKPTKFL